MSPVMNQMWVIILTCLLNERYNMYVPTDYASAKQMAKNHDSWQVEMNSA